MAGLPNEKIIRYESEDGLHVKAMDMGELVRCKDCKNWEYDVILPDGYCRGRHQWNPNWFCADGERKDDGNS